MLDHLHATAFQHTPLGRTILGSAQNIRSMTKEDVEAYIRAHYTAGACAACCVLDTFMIGCLQAKLCRYLHNVV